MAIWTDRKKNVRIRCFSLRSAICHRQANFFMNQAPQAVFRAERGACIFKLVPLFKGKCCRVNKVIFITFAFLEYLANRKIFANSRCLTAAAIWMPKCLLSFQCIRIPTTGNASIEHVRWINIWQYVFSFLVVPITICHQWSRRNQVTGSSKDDLWQSNSQSCFNGSLASHKTRKHWSGFYDKLTSQEWVLIDFETTINRK